jgi:hypothetical protein
VEVISGIYRDPIVSLDKSTTVSGYNRRKRFLQKPLGFGERSNGPNQ